MDETARCRGPILERGEVSWADLGEYRPREQTGRKPAVIGQSDTLIWAPQSALLAPLTTNLDRAKLAGIALIGGSSLGLPEDSVALAFQLRAVRKSVLKSKVRGLDVNEIEELELPTDEALGRINLQ